MLLNDLLLFSFYVFDRYEYKSNYGEKPNSNKLFGCTNKQHKQ